MGMMPSDMDKSAKTDSAFLSNLGASIGNLSLSLKGFEHKAADFEFDWDLQYALNTIPRLKFVQNDRQRKCVQIFMNNYINYLLPALINDKLPKSIIHGDLNDMNMFVNLREDD